MNSLSCAVLVACALLGGVQAKLFTDCGSTLGKIKSVKISGCDGSTDICVLHRNTNVTFDIDFEAAAAVDSVTTVVHGIMMNLPVPFPLAEPDACKDSGLKCPLKPKTDYHYVATMPVLKSYPKVAVEVKWELQNNDDEDIVCILIPAKIH